MATSLVLTYKNALNDGNGEGASALVPQAEVGGGGGLGGVSAARWRGICYIGGGGCGGGGGGGGVGGVGWCGGGGGVGGGVRMVGGV